MHVAHVTGSHPVAHVAMGRVEAPVEADLHADAGLGGRRDAAVDLGQVERQRLLDEGRLPRGRNLHQQIDVGVGGAAHGHCIHIVGLDQLRRARRVPGPERLGHRGRSLADDVVDGRQRRARDPPGNQFGVHGPDAPAAQQPDADRIAHEPASRGARLDTNRPLRSATS